jgi:hypothetical protein
MSVMTVFIAGFLSLVCISAAVVLVRLIAVKQTKSETEKLLTQVNREVKIRRRVRAGAPSDVPLPDFRHHASPSKTRIRFPTT